MIDVGTTERDRSQKVLGFSVFIMAEAALTSLRLELEEARSVIEAREKELVDLRKAIADAQIRKRELDALRSKALVEHLRKHAQEAEQARALEACSKAIEAAWSKIKELHAQRAEVSKKRAQHESANERLKQMKVEHAESVRRVEAIATLGERLLERETAGVCAVLRKQDAERAAAEKAADQTPAELAQGGVVDGEEATSPATARNAGEPEAEDEGDADTAADACGPEATNVEQAPTVTQRCIEAVDDETSAHVLDDERLRATIFELLQRVGPADASTLLSELRRQGTTHAHARPTCGIPRLERILKEMQDSWMVFQVSPGCFRSL